MVSAVTTRPSGLQSSASSCSSNARPHFASPVHLPRCIRRSPRLMTPPQMSILSVTCTASTNQPHMFTARPLPQQRKGPEAVLAASLPPENENLGEKAASSSPISVELSLSSSSSSNSSSDEEYVVPSSSSDDGSDSKEVKIDLELPRRSRLVSFTCNICGGRSERLVNPIAWDRGMVIVKCQHCEAWHKIADAANLVEEIRYKDLENLINSDDEL